MPWNPATDLPNITGYLPTHSGVSMWTGTAGASTHPVEFQDYLRIESGVGGLVWTAASLDSSPWLTISGGKCALRFDSLGSVASPQGRTIDLTGSAAQFNHFHVNGTGYGRMWIRFYTATNSTIETVIDSRRGANANKGWSIVRTAAQVMQFQVSGGSGIVFLSSSGTIADTNWHLIEWGMSGVGTGNAFITIDGVVTTGNVNNTLTTGNATDALRLGVRSGTSIAAAKCEIKGLVVTSSVPSAPDLALLAAYDPAFVSGYDTSDASPLGVRLKTAAGGNTLYPGDTTSAADLGTAARTALSNMSAAGDYLVFGAATYQLDSTSFELYPGAAMVGVGNSTVLQSSITNASDSGKCCVQLSGDGSVVANMWIKSEPASNASYSFPIGRSAAASGVCTNAIAYGCKITGYSDCLYLENTDLGSSILLARCNMSSAYDAIALIRSNAGDYCRAHYCTITVTAPFAGKDAANNGPPAQIANNVVTRGGTIDLFNCTLSTTMANAAATIVTCIRTQDGAGVINAIDTGMHVSAAAGATGVYDADNDGTGSITINRGTGSGPAGVPTTSGDGSAVVKNGPFTPRLSKSRPMALGLKIGL